MDGEHLKFTASCYGIGLIVLLAGCHRMDLEEKSVDELQAALAADEITSVEIVEGYLDRIEALDPKLNAILEINPDALTIAEGLDAERAQGTTRSSLHGIPVLLKDNLDTADGMRTTAGSLALMDAPTPQADAFLVQALREAGIIVLGKTNLSEWANFRSTESSSGWSAIGGQTHNAYILDRTPCGSSSGSAVAVAADLAPLAIGTETDGSIICPSANNGVVGIKPTVGLVSRTGIIPISHSQDAAGPMAKTVSGAAKLLTIMAGADPKDHVTADAPSLDYANYLDMDGLTGKRIGVLRQFFGRNAKT
ncbi:MAG: amidase, partial [Pseudomonadales bacterium]|nr:amidase [Pseudomonadales bacterium]